MTRRRKDVTGWATVSISHPLVAEGEFRVGGAEKPTVLSSTPSIPRAGGTVLGPRHPHPSLFVGRGFHASKGKLKRSEAPFPAWDLEQ